MYTDDTSHNVSDNENTGDDIRNDDDASQDVRENDVFRNMRYQIHVFT